MSFQSENSSGTVLFWLFLETMIQPFVKGFVDGYHSD